MEVCSGGPDVYGEASKQALGSFTENVKPETCRSDVLALSRILASERKTECTGLGMKFPQRVKDRSICAVLPHSLTRFRFEIQRSTDQ